jgi:hypothetical protein
MSAPRDRAFVGLAATPGLSLELRDDEPVVTPSYECDSCGESFTGRPHGAGLFIWTRGDELRFEEPPLCEGCAERLGLLGELSFIAGDDEEEG